MPEIRDLWNERLPGTWWSRSAGEKGCALRLEMAADRMARQLLGLAESAASEAVQLAATNSALDRGGIQAKTAVSVVVSAETL